MQGSIHCCHKNDNDKILHFCSKRSVYWGFALLRLLLVFIPQTSYIHPDEFFQSIEVAAGDTFDVDVYRTWEYNATFPARSSIFPQLCVGLPYMFLNGLNLYTEYYLGISLKTPYFMVIFPRLVMTLLSFVSDYCLFKICTIFREPYVDRMNIFASSYVMLVHCTRTFSNSIEMILTSVLIYYVTRRMAFSNKVVDAAKRDVERTSMSDCFCLATLAIVGTFIRPTFVAFAFPPIFFWLQRGLGSKNFGFMDFHMRIFKLAVCAITAIICLIVYDSFYFGHLTSEEVGKWEISIDNFVVTPINLIKYNALTENLKQHGLHPRFLHFLVNVPLLFNILGIFGIVTFIRMVNSGLQGRWMDLPRIQSIESLMMASFVAPIALLSVFPHQEPRYIIPVFFPLVFLFARWIQSSDIGIIDTSRNEKSTPPVTPKMSSKITIKCQYVNYKKIWYLSNIILAIFYGFIHQGGVLPLASHLAKELKSKPDPTHVHLYISHTYRLPTGLLHLRNTKKSYVSDSGHKYKLVKDFYLNELGSASVEVLHEKLALAIHDRELDRQLKNIPYRLYYVLPYSLYAEFLDYTLSNETRFFDAKVAETFYPHLSLEKPPQFHVVANCLSFHELPKCIFKFVESPWDNVVSFFKQFSLVLLRIEPVTER